MTFLVQLFKSKTVVFNLLSLLAVIFALPEIQVFISSEHLLMAQAVVNLILRFLTTVAVTEKTSLLGRE